MNDTPTPATSSQLPLFVEEVALILEQSGLNRTAGRILGRLLVCEPAHQSSKELADALHVSRASISTGTRLLLQLKMLRKVPVHASRETYFALSDTAWSDLMQGELARVLRMRELAQRGLEMVAAEGVAPQRMHDFHEWFAFFEQEFPALIERFEAQRTSR
ncbi:MAG: GbsR/MarR family transcriptional regulator [Myxococcota bacterium]